ncbi:MAG: Holliday junction resolvase RuvX [Lachnospiraceae bacterium]|nr:Holliday junction resolvase RuvX [Lachnospiraceae bacterium]
MRILGLDYGSKTVGVAVSDPLGLTAQGVEIIRREKENHLRKTYSRIEELIEEYSVDLVVIGLPLNMDDSEGERAKLSREFGEGIERRTGLKVEFQDERLSSFEAEEEMASLGIKRSDFKKHVDRIAAQIILEDYMRAHNIGANK